MPQRRLVGVVLLALAVGLVVGVLTSLLQTHLAPRALVDDRLRRRRAPSADLHGHLGRSSGKALQVVAYYVTSDVRGFGVSMSYVLL